jgi:hypothetical protein
LRTYPRAPARNAATTVSSSECMVSASTPISGLAAVMASHADVPSTPALSLLGVLSIVVFWMAVGPLLGLAAVGLALEAPDRRPFRGQRLADVAAVLGALVSVAGVVLAFVG